MSLLNGAGIKSATAALALVLFAGQVFAAAETPTPHNHQFINEDNAEAFWENLIESEKANNERLAADASVPP